MYMLHSIRTNSPSAHSSHFLWRGCVPLLATMTNSPASKDNFTMYSIVSRQRRHYRWTIFNNKSSLLWAFALACLFCHDDFMLGAQAFTVARKNNCQAHFTPMKMSRSSATDIPSEISSPVLKQVYPHLVAHIEEYGHPNIPLGSAAGRQCQTLRKLQTQKKLSDVEVELLTEMNFRFHSLEDVYHEVDFDELFQRLVDYEQEYMTGFQVPKKYELDPELGAWVTGIRRLGPTGVQPNHADKLNEVGFAWKSNRKCGSKFMQQYRAIRERIDKGEEGVLESTEVQEWLGAQRDAYKRGALGETRSHYMAQVFGEEWNQ